MKTPRWFTRNRLSYLRIPAAVTLIVAAAGIAFVAASPDPPNTRLTNDDPALSGYTSDYTLVTGVRIRDPGDERVVTRIPAQRRVVVREPRVGRIGGCRDESDSCGSDDKRDSG